MESKDDPIFNTEKIKELINQSIEEYLAVDHEHDDQLGTISRHGKRPAPLLPQSILLNNKKPKNLTIPQPFFGPGTNCSELFNSELSFFPKLDDITKYSLSLKIASQQNPLI